jgi:hypothetical protein
VLKINVYIIGFLCEIMILVHEHEQDKVCFKWWCWTKKIRFVYIIHRQKGCPPLNYCKDIDGLNITETFQKKKLKKLFHYRLPVVAQYKQPAGPPAV